MSSVPFWKKVLETGSEKFLLDFFDLCIPETLILFSLFHYLHTIDGQDYLKMESELIINIMVSFHIVFIFYLLLKLGYVFCEFVEVLLSLFGVCNRVTKDRRLRNIKISLISCQPFLILVTFPLKDYTYKQSFHKARSIFFHFH